MYEGKMIVMQVRPNYSIIYQFKPELKIEEEYIKDKKELNRKSLLYYIPFIKFLKHSANWKTGKYFLKCSKGTFASFEVEGKNIKLLKKSTKGKDYLCWNIFQ